MGETEILTSWRVFKFLKPHYLSDMGGRMVVEPRIPAMAECENEEHRPPEKDCMCGLWSFREFEELKVQGYNRQGEVLAEVYSWGRVQVFEKCYKSEFMYPKALYLMPGGKLEPLRGWIEEKYGVPVVMGSADMWRHPKSLEIVGRSTTPYVPPTRMTQEGCWAIVTAGKEVELKLKKVARNWLRQKYYMRNKALEKRIPALERTLDRAKKEQLGVLRKQAILNQLAEQWKKGE